MVAVVLDDIVRMVQRHHIPYRLGLEAAGDATAIEIVNEHIVRRIEVHRCARGLDMNDVEAAGYPAIGNNAVIGTRSGGVQRKRRRAAGRKVQVGVDRQRTGNSVAAGRDVTAHRHGSGETAEAT